MQSVAKLWSRNGVLRTVLGQRGALLVRLGAFQTGLYARDRARLLRHERCVDARTGVPLFMQASAILWASAGAFHVVFLGLQASTATEEVFFRGVVHFEVACDGEDHDIDDD